MPASAATIGLDVGDRSTQFCALDRHGEIIAEGKLRTVPEALDEHFGRGRRAESCSRLGRALHG